MQNEFRVNLLGSLHCVQSFDVADIGEQHDLTHLFTDRALQKDRNLIKQD
ncbi:hypothetical protein [Helicobacter bilis]|nr:hypothetical protein [Helicobacter bilis]